MCVCRCKLRAEKRQVAVNNAGRFSCFYFGENFDTKNHRKTNVINTVVALLIDYIC